MLAKQRDISVDFKNKHYKDYICTLTKKNHKSILIVVVLYLLKIENCFFWDPDPSPSSPSRTYAFSGGPD